jgi:hypothetical protein
MCARSLHHKLLQSLHLLNCIKGHVLEDIVPGITDSESGSEAELSDIEKEKSTAFWKRNAPNRLLDTANNSSATDPRLVGILNDRISQDVDMLTLRINYGFGGYAAPVTACG